VRLVDWLVEVVEVLVLVVLVEVVDDVDVVLTCVPPPKSSTRQLLSSGKNMPR
jgi:hypothetical protein